MKIQHKVWIAISAATLPIAAAAWLSPDPQEACAGGAVASSEREIAVGLPDAPIIEIHQDVQCAAPAAAVTSKAAAAAKKPLAKPKKKK